MIQNSHRVKQRTWAYAALAGLGRTRFPSWPACLHRPDAGENEDSLPRVPSLWCHAHKQSRPKAALPNPDVVFLPIADRVPGTVDPIRRGVVSVAVGTVDVVVPVDVDVLVDVDVVIVVVGRRVRGGIPAELTLELATVLALDLAGVAGEGLGSGSENDDDCQSQDGSFRESLHCVTPQD